MGQKTFIGVKAAMLSVIVFGIIILAYSTYFVSSFFAMIGFSILFWGVILLYVIPTSNSFLDLLNSVVDPSAANIERILTEYNINQQGIYLSTEDYGGLFNEFQIAQNAESVLVFFPDIPNSIQENTYRPKTDVNGGLYLTPPGQALCKVLEQRFGKSFSKVSRQQFINKLPMLLTNEFKLVENLEIAIKENITVTITKSILDQSCKETNNQPKTNKQIGSLLTSAIACATTKVIGKPIVIQNETYDPQSRTTKIQYRILETIKD